MHTKVTNESDMANAVRGLSSAGQRGKMPKGEENEKRRAVERAEAQIHAFVEDWFQVLKNVFRHTKAKYRNIFKNGEKLMTLVALPNVVLATTRVTHYVAIAT